MGILANIKNIIMGTAKDAGESFVNSNADTLITEQIRQARQELKEAETALVSVNASKIKSKNEITRLEEKKAKAILAVENYVKKNETENANTLMAQIETDLMPLLATEQKNFAFYESKVKELQKQQSVAKQRINNAENQAQILKAQASANKATAIASSSVGTLNSKSGELQATLDRLQERVDNETIRLQSAEELHDESESRSMDNLIDKANATATEELSLEERLAALKK